MKRQTKSTIRSKVLKLLRNQKEEDRLRKSEAVRKKLFSLKEFKGAKTILFYAAFDGEVETFEMIKQAKKLKKIIALPTVIKAHRRLVPRLVRNLRSGLRRGAYGILEPRKDRCQPIDLSKLDLVLVPGIAFDRSNHRLGRGFGYYDRFLRRLPIGTPAVGLAFDFQLFRRLPDVQPHDVQLSRIVVS